MKSIRTRATRTKQPSDIQKEEYFILTCTRERSHYKIGPRSLPAILSSTLFFSMSVAVLLCNFVQQIHGEQISSLLAQSNTHKLLERSSSIEIVFFTLLSFLVLLASFFTYF